MKPPVDKLGNEFKVGDYFAMALRSGDVAHMKIGRVVGIKERERFDWRTKETKVLLPSIRTVDYDFHDRLVPCRQAVMENPDRAVILPESMVPENMLNILGPLVGPRSILTSPTTCPKCSKSLVQTSHGPYCPYNWCKWGGET